MTDEEVRRLAIRDLEHDLCLSAGAGSGKTRVLIERLIHLLTTGEVGLGQLVAITFTEKAAAELKTRLASALRRQWREHPEQRKQWQERLNELERAYLGTIHSFCGLLLRENPIEADVDPDFTVLDEVAGEALRRETLTAWLDEALTAAQRGEGPLARLLEYVDLHQARIMLEQLVADPVRYEGVAAFYEGQRTAGSSSEGEEGTEEEPRHRDAREALWAAVAEARARFEQAKRERGLLSFDDLLRRARDLLRDHPPVRQRYQRQFRYLHIDEFQDVDGLQAELVRLLCGFEGCEVERPPRLFIVGDPQQSIYRFRGADVDQFSKMERAILERGGLSLRLTRCFRSQARLVDFFNYTFAQVFTPPPQLPAESRITYTPIEAVRGSQNGGPVVEFLFRLGKGKADERRAAEADLLARRLRQMLGEGVCPGDIAILFRAMTKVKIYEQALRAYGVPFYTIAGSGFFARPEIVDVVNLLRLLVQPHDRLALAAVLRSPWVGCADTTLYWLAAEEAWEDLASPSLGEHLSAEEKTKLDYFAAWFEALRGQRDRVPLTELLNKLLDCTRYRAVVAAWPEGRQAWANLRKLLDLARQFDAAGGPTLEDFLNYLQQRMEHTPREAEAALEVETGDTVKLLSVHRAKGLEWPVVVVADLDRGFNLPRREPLLADPAEGAGLKLLNEYFQMEAGPDYERVKSALVQREIAELQRILYVACTRARDRLILSGSFDPAEVKPQLGDEKSWLQWLAAVFDLHSQFTTPNPLPLTYPDRNGHPVPIRTALPPEMPPAERGPVWSLAQLAEVVREQATLAGPPEEDWRAQLKPPLAPMAEARVAVTELEAFAFCPRRYQWERLLHLPEEMVNVEGEEPPVPTTPEREAALSLGLLAHAALERLPKDIAPADLPGFVQRVAAGMRAEEVVLGEEVEAAVVPLLGNWLASPYWERLRTAEEVRSEVPFVVRLDDGTQLLGRFDLLFRRNGRWRGLDYKTDRVTGDVAAYVESRYGLQQRAYGLAATRLLREAFAGLDFYFLQSGEVVTWRPTPETLTAAENRVREAILAWREALSRDDFPPTGDFNRCQRCTYRYLCGR